MESVIMLFRNICILLIVNLLVMSCTKNTPIEETEEPYIDGWKIEKLQLNENIYNESIFGTDLYFIDPRNGFMIGFDNIYSTSDSGKSWIAQNSGTTIDLNSLYFLDGNIGYISGAGGCYDPDCNSGSIFLRTTDGGKQWSKISYDSLAYLESMQFTDYNNGIGIIRYFQRLNQRHLFLVKTENGGTTWNKTSINIPQNNELHKIINIQNIYYIIAENNIILKSIDFGHIWQSFEPPIPSSNKIMSMYFFNKDIGFVTDGFYKYKTIDGGNTWKKLISGPGWFNAIHFYSELEGFGFELVFDHEVKYPFWPKYKGTYIYTTKDGGITWTRSALCRNFYINDIHFPAPNIGYSIDGSMLYRFIRK